MADELPEYYEEIYDAITGVRLDPALVAKARNTEIRFLVDDLNAYKYDSVDNRLKTTGKRPMPVKWVDVNKRDAQRSEVRSRLAVAETKHRTTQTFSATPPHEALRLLVSIATRAHPHCTARRQLWVQLPAEDPRSEEEGLCGLLLR